MPHPLPAPATQGTKWSVHRAVRQGVVPATVLVVVLGSCLAASVPLEWLGQLIRTGAELAIAALNSWGDGLTSLMIAEPAPLGSLTLRGVQVLALLGILGTIPATLDLVRAIRTRAGARLDAPAHRPRGHRLGDPQLPRPHPWHRLLTPGRNSSPDQEF